MRVFGSFTVRNQSSIRNILNGIKMEPSEKNSGHAIELIIEIVVAGRV